MSDRERLRARMSSRIGTLEEARAVYAEVVAYLEEHPDDTEVAMELESVAHLIAAFERL